MKQLTGKSALITGAASGIGLATARALLRAGASVLAVDIVQDQPLSKDADAGFNVSTLRCDVQNRGAVEAAVRAAMDRLGGLHILCNCAGIASSAPFLQITEEDWQRTLGVYLYGTFTMCQAAIPAIRHSGGGCRDGTDLVACEDHRQRACYLCDPDLAELLWPAARSTIRATPAT